MLKPADAGTEVPVIEAVQAGDQSAFGELVSRHHRWVRSVIFGVLGDRDRVEDVEQQVWASVWQQAGELQDPARWRCWLYRLARNAAIDAGRDISRHRQGRHALRMHLAAQAGGSNGHAPPVDLEARERHETMMDAIRSLPDLYREPFVLRHVNGWSYKQIAEVMDLPLDTVETRLVRARRLLRERLKDKLA